jgi:hypothetical protein
MLHSQQSTFTGAPLQHDPHVELQATPITATHIHQQPPYSYPSYVSAYQNQDPYSQQHQNIVQQQKYQQQQQQQQHQTKSMSSRKRTFSEDDSHSESQTPEEYDTDMETEHSSMYNGYPHLRHSSSSSSLDGGFVRQMGRVEERFKRIRVDGPSSGSFGASESISRPGSYVSLLMLFMVYFLRRCNHRFNNRLF